MKLNWKFSRNQKSTHAGLTHSLRMILLFALLFSLLACSAQAQPTSAIVIASASQGGVWNPLAKEMARMLPQYMPGIPFSDLETLGSLDNLKLLTTGKAQLIFAHDYHVVRINQGLLTSVSANKTPVRILFGLYDQPLQIVVRADAGINSLADLKGKRVSTGIPNGCAEEMAGFVLKSLGLEIDKDIQRQKLDVIPSAEALKNNQIDAFFWTGAVPTATITRLFTESGAAISLLSIDATSAELIMRDNPGVYHSSSIPAGAYPGLEKSVETLGITAVIAAMDTLPDTLITQLLPAIFDHRTELTSAWSGAANLSAVKSLNLLSDESLEYLHPAAARYFLRSTRKAEGQKELGQNWIAECMTAGHEGSMCADSLLDFLQP